MIDSTSKLFAASAIAATVGLTGASQAASLSIIDDFDDQFFVQAVGPAATDSTSYNVLSPDATVTVEVTNTSGFLASAQGAVGASNSEASISAAASTQSLTTFTYDFDSSLNLNAIGTEVVIEITNWSAISVADISLTLDGETVTQAGLSSADYPVSGGTLSFDLADFTGAGSVDQLVLTIDFTTDASDISIDYIGVVVPTPAGALGGLLGLGLMARRRR